MKVNELIAKLQEYDGEMEVRFEHDLTLHDKSVNNIEVFGFDDYEVLVI